MILTTHSPEMMIAAGSNSLYTVLKQPESEGTNQLVRVTQSDELHAALSDLMGSRGLVSLNQRIVFIEGEEASADRAVYESLYPPFSVQCQFCACRKLVGCTEDCGKSQCPPNGIHWVSGVLLHCGPRH